MRFMMLMIPKGYETAAPGAMPDAKAVAAMMKYNESLQKAGVLLALDGLHPPSMGARVSFSGGKPKVTDGPFAEAKEVLGGYWMIQVKSKEEAIEWASRCPGARQRSDRDSPGAGVRRFPRRRPGGCGQVPRDAGAAAQGGVKSRRGRTTEAEVAKPEIRRKRDDASHGADQGHEGHRGGYHAGREDPDRDGELQRRAGEGRRAAEWKGFTRARRARASSSPAPSGP